MSANIDSIGPAGWSYKDWEGVVYPQKPGAKFDPLEYLARFFNTIEINSSFYRPFTVYNCQSPGCSESRAARDFMFTAKLHRVFTHERGKATAEDEKQVREGLDALRSAGKLARCCCSFPGRLRTQMTSASTWRNYLNDFRIIRWCSRSGIRPGTIRRFTNGWRRLGVGICNVGSAAFHEIDQAC